jgi:hypothetical protein
MRWFGRPGGAPYEEGSPHVATPVDELCAWCTEPIAADDDGLLIPHIGGEGPVERPYHYECHLRQVIGGANHLRGNCTCCGGAEPADPPYLTLRQAAQQAVALWSQRRRV